MAAANGDDGGAAIGRDESRPYGERGWGPTNGDVGGASGGRDESRPYGGRDRGWVVGGYDPEVHQRRSIRLAAYDYSLPGPYFVTICVEHRACVLGEVVDDAVVLSAAGQIVARELQRIGERNPNVSLDAAVIMPNHLHAILAIASPSPVGARFIAPTSPDDHLPQNTTTAAADRGATTPAIEMDAGDGRGGADALGGTPVDRLRSGAGGLGAMNRAPTGTGRGPKGPGAGTLGEVVRAFKAASTRMVRRDCAAGFAWQGNYFERVIRDERELRAIYEYIETNPARWATDDLFMTVVQADTKGGQ